MVEAADPDSLKDIYGRVIAFYSKVEDEGKTDVLPQAIRDCETAINLVNIAGIYGNNEDLDDLPSRNMRFLILPALLGYFTERQIGVLKRVENLEKARTYYLDFLRLCACYSMYNFEKLTKLAEAAKIDKEASTGSQATSSGAASATVQRAIIEAAIDRNAKIKRYRDEQEIKQKLTELEAKISAVPEDRDVDDELLRNTYTTLVRRWIFTAENALQTIHDELPFARRVAIDRQNSQNETSRRRSGAAGVSHQQPDAKSDNNEESNSEPRMRPFILTRSRVQKEVFGLGYPSVPVMSIEEFAEQHAAMRPLVQAAEEQARSAAINQPIMRPADCGCGSNDHAHGGGSSFGGEPIRVVRSYEVRAEQENRAEEEALVRERAIDGDDEEYLRRAREWDAFKDEHRPGEGNTYRIG